MKKLLLVWFIVGLILCLKSSCSKAQIFSGLTNYAARGIYTDPGGNLHQFRKDTGNSRLHDEILKGVNLRYFYIVCTYMDNNDKRIYASYGSVRQQGYPSLKEVNDYIQKTETYKVNTIVLSVTALCKSDFEAFFKQ